MPKMQVARKRLAQLMEERRLELEMTWTAVASEGGVSTEALRTARFGDGGIAPLTKRAIERALKWDRGSVDRILSGGDPGLAPTLLADVEPPHMSVRTIFDAAQRGKSADAGAVMDALAQLVDQLNEQQRHALLVIVQQFVEAVLDRDAQSDLAPAADRQPELPVGDQLHREGLERGEEPQVGP